MKLYEIEDAINELLENGFNEECIDAETGEIDQEKANELLDKYKAQFDEKLENIALFIKNQTSDIEAIEQEEARLKARREAKEKKVESLKTFLSIALQRNEIPKFETSKVVLSFRKSTSVEILDANLIPDMFKSQEVTIKIDKKEIKKLLTKKEEVAGAILKENQNIQIK